LKPRHLFLFATISLATFLILVIVACDFKLKIHRRRPRELIVYLAPPFEILVIAACRRAAASAEKAL
jgi:hypothetical protein